jgi:hypothetical protein
VAGSVACDRVHEGSSLESWGQQRGSGSDEATPVVRRDCQEKSDSWNNLSPHDSMRRQQNGGGDGRTGIDVVATVGGGVDVATVGGGVDVATVPFVSCDNDDDRCSQEQGDQLTLSEMAYSHGEH